MTEMKNLVKNNLIFIRHQLKGFPSIFLLHITLSNTVNKKMLELQKATFCVGTISPPASPDNVSVRNNIPNTQLRIQELGRPYFKAVSPKQYSFP